MSTHTLQLVLGLRRTSVSGVIYVRDAMQAGDDRRTRGATGGRTRRQTPATTETAGDCCARTCGAQSSEQACIDTHQRVSCADATAEATTYVPSRSSCASVADCVFETERGREGGREKERERESVCVCVCLVTACACVTCPVAQGTHNHVLTQAERAVMHLAAASGTREKPRTQPRQDTMVLPGGVWSEREDSKAAVTWTSLRSSFPCLQVRMSALCTEC